MHTKFLLENQKGRDNLRGVSEMIIFKLIADRNTVCRYVCWNLYLSTGPSYWMLWTQWWIFGFCKVTEFLDQLNRYCIDFSSSALMKVQSCGRAASIICCSSLVSLCCACHVARTNDSFLSFVSNRGTTRAWPVIRVLCGSSWKDNSFYIGISYCALKF